MQCKLCNSTSVSHWFWDKAREYLRCRECGLVFVPDVYELSIEHERKRYELHDNTVTNKGYVKYLKQIVQCVMDRTEQSSPILDFGSGKNKVLGTLLNEKGYRCDSYDPCFDINEIVSDKKYNMVILCEVIEHLRAVRKELEFISSFMAHNRTIVLRTQLYSDLDMFTSWWYKEDLTHINFFCKSAIDYAGQILGCSVIETEYKDIFLLSDLCIREGIRCV